MRLFIAEKPSLGREIAKVLGGGEEQKGYINISNGEDIVTWAFGHLLENYAPEDYDEKYRLRRTEDLPIIPNVWKMKIKEGGEAQYHIIEELLEKADVVVHAGDPDREGQLLIDELLEEMGNEKPVRRILLNALDKKSILNALDDLRDNVDFAGMRDAARARSRADWSVGMNYSRAFSAPARQAGYHGLRIGRVKTPTMAMVVRREEAIKNFKPVQYFEVQVDWSYENEIIRSIWQPSEDAAGLDLDDRLIDRQVADALLDKIRQSVHSSVHSAAVVKVDEKEVEEPQPLPYSLSALQVAAGKKYGYTPKEVLKGMQQLYENKLTTYPRSDCDYLPENLYTEAGNIIQNIAQTDERLAAFAVQTNQNIKSRAWNDEKISAHHAIVPTGEPCDFSQLDEKGRNLYFLIAQAYLAQFYPVHIYQAKTVWIANEGEKFKAKGKTIRQNGWKEIFEKDSQIEGKQEDEKSLPNITKGEIVEFQTGSILEKVTKPPTRFTPSTLLKAMKEVHKFVKDASLKTRLKSVSGIGTEATRADIIDSLVSSNFLRIEKKHLVPTESAYMMVKVLPDTLTWPDTTALWEDELEDVQQGKQTVEEFLQSKTDSIVRVVDAAKYVVIPPSKEAVPCPKCGKIPLRRQGKNGCFWGCSGYPDCTATYPDKAGKPDLEDHTMPCPACQTGRIRRLKGKYGYFWGCNNPECKKIFRDDKGKPIQDTDDVKCPSCGKPMRRRKSKTGYFWGCSGYPDCGEILQDKDGKPV